MRRTSTVQEVKATITTLIEDPATSHWLKGALEVLLHRDPMDAATDSEILANVMQARANAHLYDGHFFD